MLGLKALRVAPFPLRALAVNRDRPLRRLSSDSGSEKTGITPTTRLSISIDGAPLGDRLKPGMSGGHFRRGVPVEMTPCLAFNKLVLPMTLKG